MRQDVIDRQVRVMRERGWDALLSCSPENFAYVVGFLSPTQPLMRWRHAIALVTAGGTCSLLVIDMEASTIRSRAPDADITVWKEFEFNCMEELAGLLKRHGLASAKVGLETDYLPAADFAALTTLMPTMRFEPAQAETRAHASDQDTGRNRYHAKAVDDRRPVDLRGFFGRPRRRQRNGPGRRLDSRHLRAWRGIF